MEIFQLTDDLSGEIKGCDESSQILKDDKVYLIINNALRKIFICVGAQSGVRARFAGAFAARSLREERRLNYHVETVDEVKEGLLEEILSSISPQESYQKSKTTVIQKSKQKEESEEQTGSISPTKPIHAEIEKKPLFGRPIEGGDIQLFFLTSDGTFVEFQAPKDPSHFIKRDNVFILINNVSKKIYLWIGSMVDVNSRFNGAFSAQHMQRNYGIEYRVESIEEGYETQDFRDSLSKAKNSK